MRWKLALSILASAVFFLHPTTASAVVCGDAYFNAAIHWSTSSAVLYYTVAGAPPNTCGTAWTNRNGGGWQSTPGWICTDSNGTATKGPWSASSQSGDETADAYIDYGTCTSPVRRHIWDLEDPTVNITSPAGATYFSGNASDGSWGAGFSSSWASCLVKYYNSTTGFYWSPSAGWSEVYPYVIGTTISGMPSLNITWSANQVPSTQTGHCYTRYAQCWDGGHWGYDQESFCK